MAQPLRIVFAGTPEFAAQALEAILATGHEVCAVYTQPDRPAGRGRKVVKSPVKCLAEQHQVTVFQPESLRGPEQQAALAALNADVMVVVAYGLILPLSILQTPRMGCVNIHASLLPRWRGAAPIQRAIQAGDTETGITIIQMDEGLDTGPMLLRSPLNIADSETGGSLHDRLAQLGGQAIVQALDGLSANTLVKQTQDDSKSCYAAKLNKAEARIDWNMDAASLERNCRAFNPWPVAYTPMPDGRRLRIWMARSLPSDAVSTNAAKPGTILSVDQQGIDVLTGDGVLRLLEVQSPGARVVAVSDFVNSAPFAPGDVLGAELLVDGAD